MQNEVGKMACLDPNTLSQVIRGLEQKELVRREALEDKRAKKTILTSKGASLVKKALPKVELEDQDFFKKLTKAELKLLVKLCQKLNF